MKGIHVYKGLSSKGHIGHTNLISCFTNCLNKFQDPGDILPLMVQATHTHYFYLNNSFATRHVRIHTIANMRYAP